MCSAFVVRCMFVCTCLRMSVSVFMCVYVRRLIDVRVRADTLWMITRAKCIAADCYVNEVTIYSC